jgi:hypothetical protein
LSLAPGGIFNKPHYFLSLRGNVSIVIITRSNLLSHIITSHNGALVMGIVKKLEVSGIPGTRVSLGCKDEKNI